MTRLILLTLSLALAGNAAAATVYVDAANTTGVEDGTAAAPFDSIQEAIQAAVVGDEVSVAPGVYYGSIQLRDGVPVVSQKGPYLTLIDGLGANPAVQTDSTVRGGRSTLRGFTIKNAAWLLGCSAYPYAWAYIDDCIFTDAAWGAISTSGGCGMFLTRSVIRNVPMGIYPFLNAMNIFTRNVTFDTVGSAFYMYKAYAVLQNTTITNSDTAFGLFGYTGWGVISGDHNNVWNVTTLAGLNMNGTLTCNLSQLAAPMSADPAFKDWTNGDLHLTAGSPLVDAGVDVGLPFVGDAPDIGAYELTEIPLPDQIAALAESYATISADAFRNVAAQRANAFQNKLLAVLGAISLIDPALPAADQIALYTDVINKLRHDLLAKSDGFYGGKPQNDWITTKEAQDLIVPELMELIAAVQAKIDALAAPAAP